ncbi:MAG: cupin domain-containing protein, partial [Planctomycetes bacterium]|nr:cupin domain-containing protein [Planctomycetota bacterium]
MTARRPRQPSKSFPWLVQYGVEPRRALPRPALVIHSLYYKEATRAYSTALHSHRMQQWFVCVHGGMDVAVDGVAHPLGPGDSLFVTPGGLRECRTRGRAPGYLIALFESD